MREFQGYLSVNSLAQVIVESVLFSIYFSCILSVYRMLSYCYCQIRLSKLHNWSVMLYFIQIILWQTTDLKVLQRQNVIQMFLEYSHMSQNWCYECSIFINTPLPKHDCLREYGYLF